MDYDCDGVSTIDLHEITQDEVDVPGEKYAELQVLFKFQMR